MNDLNWERFKATLVAEGAAIRSELRQEMAVMREQLRAEIAGLRDELAGLHTEIASMRADLMKWMFIYWMGSVITLGGLMLAILRTR